MLGGDSGQPVQRGSSAVDLNTYITAVFCLADDWLQEQESPRRRGPATDISDSEGLTPSRSSASSSAWRPRRVFTPTSGGTTVSGSPPSVGSTAPVSPSTWPGFGH